MKHRRWFMVTFFVAIALVANLVSPAMPPVAQASQTGPQMLGDFRSGTLSSNPYSFMPFGEKMLFAADGPDSEEQPWITDGTQQGTYLLKDIAPGSYSQTYFGAVLNGEAYFSASSPENGQELWKTDGTPAGTQMVVDLFPGPGSSHPGGMIAANGQLYMVASPDTGYLDHYLYRVDSSPSGISQIGNIKVHMQSLTVYDGRVYFIGSTTGASQALWRTTADGLGVEQVANLLSVSLENYASHYFTVMDGNLYFITAYQSYGQLWISDGTSQGTQIIKDFTGTDYPQGLTIFNGQLYFGAAENNIGCTLWRSDGTTAGTAPVAGAPAPVQYGCPSNFTALGNELFFNDTDAALGSELWKLDGVSGSISLVSDINPGPGSSYPSKVVDLDGVLYFGANVTGDPDSADLWRTEGTPETTYEVKHCHMPENQWNLVGCGYLTKWKGGLLFSGFDPLHGQELWTSDGTSQGTQFSIDVNTGQVGSGFDGGIFYKNALYFRLRTDGIQDTLWRSDGTPGGTQKFADIAPWGQGSGISRRTGYEPTGELGGILYFAAADPAHGREMWRTDGTSAGTWMVKDIDQSPATSYIDYLVTTGDYFYFTYSSSTSGYSGIYRSDGTEAGTVKVVEFLCGDGLEEVNGKVIFTCDHYYGLYNDYTDTSIYQLSYDGGLKVIATINRFGSFYWHVKTGSLIFFTSGYRNSASPLYQTDGESVQTINLVNASYAQGYFDLLTPAGNTLFFVTKSTAVNKLWRLDPGSADALMVKELPGVPITMVALNGKVFLRVQNGSGSEELWTSDGTADGTQSVCPSCGITKMGWAVAWQGRLYFTATDAAHGTELWQSDGTAAGTRLYLDVRPGPESSNPAYLTAQGDKLFFAADDGVHGSEPWEVVRVLDQKAYLPVALK